MLQTSRANLALWLFSYRNRSPRAGGERHPISQNWSVLVQKFWTRRVFEIDIDDVDVNGIVSSNLISKSCLSSSTDRFKCENNMSYS